MKRSTSYRLGAHPCRPDPGQMDAGPPARRCDRHHPEDIFSDVTASR